MSHTLGDIILKGIEAVGGDPNSEAVKAFLIDNQKVITMPVESGKELEQFRSEFMTFKDAIAAERVTTWVKSKVDEDFRSVIHGKHMELIEKEARAGLEKAGAWSAEKETLLRGANGIENKMRLISEWYAQTGSGGGGSEEVTKLKEAIEGYKQSVATMEAREAEKIQAGIEPYKAEAQAARQGLLEFKIMNKASGQMQFINQQVANLALPEIIRGQILSKYHINPDDSDMTLYDKANPEKPVIDPETGHKVSVSELLESAVPKELLKTQNDTNTGGGAKVFTTTDTKTDTGGKMPQRVNKAIESLNAQIKAAQGG